MTRASSAWFPVACYVTFTFLGLINLTDARTSSGETPFLTTEVSSPGSHMTNRSAILDSSHSRVTDSGLDSPRATLRFEDNVSLQPKLFKECLQNGGFLRISAKSGDIRFGDNGAFRDKSSKSVGDKNERLNESLKLAEYNHSSGDPFKRECLVKLSVPAGLVLKLTLEFCSEINLQAYELPETDNDTMLELNRSREPSRFQNGVPAYTLQGRGVVFLDMHNSPTKQPSQTQSSTSGEKTTADPGLETRALMTEGCDGWYPPTHVFSQMSTVWLALEDPRNDTRDKLAFHLRFAAVEKSEAAEYQLEVVQTSPTRGYIQNPGWDGKTKQYPPLMRSCVTITTPKGYSIFISFVRLVITGSRCDEDDEIYDDSELVAEYVGTCSDRSRMERKYCSVLYRNPLPHLSQPSSTSLSLYFASKNNSEAETFGFRVHYSIHKSNALLKRCTRRTWNCSTSLWPDFERHFPCDLVPQCVGGEDEAHCPYTGSRCGPGKFEVRGRCYLLGRQNYRRSSWNLANDQCLRLGATLVNLETPPEWNDVIQLLQRYSIFYLIHVGLKTPETVLPSIYHNAWQWRTGVIAYQLNIKGVGSLPLCALITSAYYRRQNHENYTLFVTGCNRKAHKAPNHFVCEFPSPEDDSPAAAAAGGNSAAPPRPPSLVPSSAAPSQSDRRSLSAVQLVACPQGHLTFTFAACTAESACWTSSPERGECKAPMTPLPPSFQCADGLGSVPYTLVCDFRQDCRDFSDENFCDFSPCVGDMLPCGKSGQCYPRKATCDYRIDCVSGTDEACCNMKRLALFRVITPPPPSIVVFTGQHKLEVRSLDSPDCPAAHFKCPGDGYCLPVFVRCNGVLDCAGREDEAGCDSYTCPGFYRCRQSRICVDVEDLCDGLTRCPQHDDELLCGLTCPDACTCHGLGFFCRRKFSAEDHPSIRFLDARGTGMSLGQVANNTFLVHLDLGDCKVQELSLIRLTRLHSLDLSDNNLLVVDMRYLKKLKHLRKLVLAGNPLAGFMAGDFLSVAHVSRSLHDLDLSRTLLRSFSESTANALTNLKKLNFSHSRLDSLDRFEALVNLRVLDVRGSSLAEFQPNVLRGMYDLNWMYADNPKLCCSGILPASFNLNRCFAPVDEISSCEALLRSVVYRVALAMFAVLTLLGNLFCFVYRVRLPPSVKKLGFNVFVTQLCLSDFLMGVYLAVIGVADRAYLGSYLWKDVAWKSSAACKMAGFFSLLSSETSAMIVSLITVERFIVIRFPFSRVHFVGRSAYVASGLSWFLGLLLASVPLLPETRRWNFYSQTGICIPLPITRKEFPGHSYSFGVMIVCNLGLFVLIAAGQALIYWSVQANTMTSATDSSSKAKDAVIARRLLTVVMSDFLCWFPIGLCGVLSSNGYPVPGEVNVAMAIFVLPLNSALNPFLYTLNLVHEKRQKTQEERIKKFLLSNIKTGIS